MRSLCKGLALLAISALAAPALADTVYVPLATDVVIDGIRYQTQVTFTNQSDTSRQATYYFIPAGSNGSERPAGGEERTTVDVAPQSSVVVTGVTDGVEQTGVLEVSGAEQILVGAKLVVAADGGVGANIPVVSSLTAISADRTIYLSELDRSDSVLTDFNIFNASKVQATCVSSATAANGTPLTTNTSLTVPALSLLRFKDVLQILQLPTADSARISVTCNQPFYAYALTLDRQNGHATVIGPSEALTSALTRPGTSPGPSPNCAPDAVVCFTLPGTFHAPTNASNDVRRVEIPIPPGRYERLQVSLNIDLGPWGQASEVIHNVFWLVKDRNFNMFLYPNLRGPNRNSIFFRHGVGLTHPQKLKVEVPAVFTPGQRYFFEGTYDTRNQRILFVAKDNAGNVVNTIDTRPNSGVSHIDFAPGEKIVIDFGFQVGNNPGESPTLGWVYNDLKFELFR